MASDEIEVSFEEEKNQNEAEIAATDDKTKIETDETGTAGKPENSADAQGESASEAEGDHGNSAPPWVKDVRRRNKTLSRENAELKRRLQDAAPTGGVIQKPNMSEFQTEESYADALIAWKQSSQSQEAAAQNSANEWQGQVSEYLTAKRDFPQEQFTEDEFVVEAAMSEDQQRALVAGFGSDAPSLVVGLANSPEKLAKLVKISNPAKFAVELAKLHSSMRVKNRRPKTTPETRIKGDQVGVGASKSLDKMLDNSNDLTAYMQARKAKRRK